MRASIKNNKSFLMVIVLFAVSVVLRGVLGDFPKALRIYPDELRYVSIARSLFQGQGLQIHHLDTDFQKILYSICILPAFWAESTAVQIRLIGYINSVIITSSIFPVYALCRKLCLNQRETNVILLFWATLPTLLNSMYFMSEVVYLPLSLWVIYCVYCIWHSERQSEQIRLHILLGALCYLAYLCKEIALYFVLAYILVWIIRSAALHLKWKQELVCAAVFAGVFVLCFLAMKLTVFYGMQNSYSSFNLSGVRGLALLQHPEKMIYLVYAVVYDTMYAMVAMGVFPILIPLFFFDKNKKISWFYLFLLIAFLIGCATIAYTITLPEEFGKRSPRQHLRYLEPFAIPFYSTMLYHLRSTEDGILYKKVLTGIICLFSGVFVLMGAGGGSSLVDNTMLVYYEFFVRFISKADWMSFLIRVLMAVVLILGTRLLWKNRETFTKLFAVLFFCLNLVNSAAGYAASVYRYAISEEQRTQASQANDNLRQIEGTILLISDDGWESEDSRLFDTYMDRDYYVTEMDLIKDSEMDLEMQPITCYFPYESYRELTKVDYLIVKEEYGIQFQEDTVEEIMNFPMIGYQLYKNRDPEHIVLE